jgi:hypothetical protein
VAWIGQQSQQRRFKVEAHDEDKKVGEGRADPPWTENEPYSCGLHSFPAARTEYGSCDIQREPGLEITSRKNCLEGG